MDILYVGGFCLPDKNAAAQRVIANAAALREIGHNVVFVNTNNSCGEAIKNEYFGFECYDFPPQNIIESLFSFKAIKKILGEREFGAVIAYNYPAPKLSMLISYCKKHGIRCVADATEWYQPQGNVLYRFVKSLDTEWRMRRLHFHMDGVITISEYLYQYYCQSVLAVKIPPLVDLTQEKWTLLKKKNPDDECIDFIYCGTPSAQKECLDKIVDAVENFQGNYLIKLSIIGITQEQYERMYGVNFGGTRTIFLGRMSHELSLQRIALSDWSIIIRENNKVVQAGFPTKLPESFSCGTPVIINKFSNVEDYINENNSIVTDINNIEHAISSALSVKKNVDRLQFDYHGYLDYFVKIIGS